MSGLTREFIELIQENISFVYVVSIIFSFLFGTLYYQYIIQRFLVEHKIAYWNCDPKAGNTYLKFRGSEITLPLQEPKYKYPPDVGF